MSLPSATTKKTIPELTSAALELTPTTMAYWRAHHDGGKTIEELARSPPTGRAVAESTVVKHLLAATATGLAIDWDDMAAFGPLDAEATVLRKLAAVKRVDVHASWKGTSWLRELADECWRCGRPDRFMRVDSFNNQLKAL